MPGRAWLGLLGLLLLGVAACETAPTPAPPTPLSERRGTPVPIPSVTPLPPTVTETALPPTITPTPDPGRLPLALAWAPASVPMVRFTDWAVIKDYAGVTGLTSASPLTARVDFLATLNDHQAAPANYAGDLIAQYAAVWGWDTTDLNWEATLLPADGSPIDVLQFRPDFDFADFQARLTAAGFAAVPYETVPVYSRALTPADVHFPTDLDLQHTAILAADRVLVFSADEVGVQAVLDVRRGVAPALVTDEGISTVTGDLGPVAGALVSQSDAACAATRLSEGQVGRLPSAAQEALGQITPYRALGLGYRYAGQQPVSLAAMLYSDTMSALGELGPRQTLADDSPSLALDPSRPYRQAVFQLQSTIINDSDLIFRGPPATGQPARLFQAFAARDLAFASCP